MHLDMAIPRGDGMCCNVLQSVAVCCSVVMCTHIHTHTYIHTHTHTCTHAHASYTHTQVVSERNEWPTGGVPLRKPFTFEFFCHLGQPYFGSRMVATTSEDWDKYFHKGTPSDRPTNQRDSKGVY